MKARLHAAAEQELAAAVALDEARGSGLDFEFLAEVRRVAALPSRHGGRCVDRQWRDS